MGILQKILSKPIQHLLSRPQKLPNIEVLRLYRQVYKFTNKFYWNNQKGQPWKNVLRKSIRKQFDLSKHEIDSFMIMKMMITTRQCMKQMDSKLCAAQYQFINNVHTTRNQSSK